MATNDQFVGLHSQMNEIVKRVGNGSLDPTRVKRSLQDIIEGKLSPVPWNPPRWWRTPEDQLKLAHQLWPNAVLPQPPTEFQPATPSEVLLLHVPDTFDSLWDKVELPLGYVTRRDNTVQSDRQHMRLAPNVPDRTEPTWLVFDPEHGKGLRPNFVWHLADIAASEVFSALIQFPDWPLTWGRNASEPNLSGYQLMHDGLDRLCVPFLHIWHENRRLELSDHWADHDLVTLSSPTVREC